MYNSGEFVKLFFNREEQDWGVDYTQDDGDYWILIMGFRTPDRLIADFNLSCTQEELVESFKDEFRRRAGYEIKQTAFPKEKYSDFKK